MNDPEDTTWSGKIDGMRIYSGQEVESLLKQAGFTIQTKDAESKKRICIVASKNG